MGSNSSATFLSPVSFENNYVSQGYSGGAIYTDGEVRGVRIHVLSLSLLIDGEANCACVCRCSFFLLCLSCEKSIDHKA